MCPSGILESNFIIYTDVDYFLKCKITGIMANNNGTIIENAFPKILIAGVSFELLTPSD